MRQSISRPGCRRFAASVLAVLAIVTSASAWAGDPRNVLAVKLSLDPKLSAVPEKATPIVDGQPGVDSASAPTIAKAGSAEAMPSIEAAAAEASAAIDRDDDPLLKLGPGDLVAVQVFGRPEMSTSAYVADNGNITVPLVGAVKVAGMSPDEASKAVASALKKGQFLINPQVNMTLQQYKSQQVSVLGEVKTPGRYPLESRTGLFDLLAQAGGLNQDASPTGYLLRKNKGGATERIAVDLKNLTAENQDQLQRLKGGDSLYIPKSAQFYIYGEVRAPNRYRLEPGMIVLQALALGGGITDRGSESRIQIKRKLADGTFKTISAKPADAVQADDVIRVKERIF